MKRPAGMSILRALVCVGLLALAATAGASVPVEPAAGPETHVCAVHGDTELEAHVFTPQPEPDGSAAAVAVLHGGGWMIGKACHRH